MQFNLRKHQWLEIGRSAGWVKPIKTAYRRNAPQNEYKTPFEILEGYANRPDVDTLYISYVSELQSNVAIPEKAVRDTKSPKVGINPRSHYNTPLGVYTYPLKEIWHDIKTSRSLQRVPFKGDSPYIAVLKRNDRCQKKFIKSIEAYSDKDKQMDEDLLKRHFVPALLTEEQFQYLKDCSYNSSSKHNAIYSMWNLTRILSLYLALLEKGDIFKDTGQWINGEFIKEKPTPLGKEDSYKKLKERIESVGQGYELFPDKQEGKLNIPSVKWNKIMSRILGYAGFADKTGEGYIHRNEKIQAVFFEPTAYIVLENIKNENKGDALVGEYASTKDQQKVWDTLKKLPAGHRSEKILENMLKLPTVKCPMFFIKNISQDVSAFPLINNAKQNAIKFWIEKITVEVTEASVCPIRDIAKNPVAFEIIKKEIMPLIVDNVYILRRLNLPEIEQDPEIKGAAVEKLKTLNSSSLVDNIPKSYLDDTVVWKSLIYANPELWSAFSSCSPVINKQEEDKLFDFVCDYWRKRLKERPELYYTCPIDKITDDPSIIEDSINAINVISTDNKFFDGHWCESIRQLLNVLNSKQGSDETGATLKPTLIKKITELFKSSLNFHDKSDIWNAIKKFDEIAYSDAFWEEVLPSDMTLLRFVPYDIAEKSEKLRPLLVQHYKTRMKTEDYNLAGCPFNSIRTNKELVKINVFKNPLSYGQAPIDVRNDIEVIKSTIEFLRHVIIDNFPNGDYYRIKSLIKTYSDWFPEQLRSDAEIWAIALSKQIGFGFHQCPKELRRSEPVLKAIQQIILADIDFADELYNDIENLPEIKNNVQLFADALREFIYNRKAIKPPFNGFKHLVVSAKIVLIETINSIPEGIQKEVIKSLNIEKDVSVMAIDTIQAMISFAKESLKFSAIMELFKTLVFCENLVDLDTVFGGVDNIILIFKDQLIRDAVSNHAKASAFFYDMPKIKNSKAMAIIDKEVEALLNKKEDAKENTITPQPAISPIENNSFQGVPPKTELPEEQEKNTIKAKKNSWNSFFITSSIRNISEIL